jgi:signal transduction histidine kinase
VAERILARGEGGAGGWLESACKGILTFRAGILLITVVALWGEDGDRTLPAAAILVAAVTTAIPLRYWDRVGPVLVRHPGYLAGELVLATLILLMTGVNSPFFYYTLSTALLGGLVYGWPGAGLFSVMLIGVYFWVFSIRDEQAATLVMPAFYPLIACAGAALRGLLDRQAETESELASQSERTKLARDMHDSLAKTVSGMGFAALALARRIERDPAGAADEARRLAEDARQATREAREIIIGLRTDAGEQLPLAATLQGEARRWSESSGVQVALMVEEVGELHPIASRELEWILREALRNIERHAGATAVTVRLRRLGGRAVLTVADDGAGFEVPEALEELAHGRHFGVTGMRERAQLAGGELSVESAPGDGCVLSVWMPAEAPAAAATPQPPPPPPPPPAAPQDATPAAPADTLPSRSVPGYTWR